MNIKKFALEIIAEGEQVKPGEEVDVEYVKLPLSLQNLMQKMRLREANFKRVTKKSDRGTSTYSLYFKQTTQIKLLKQNLKNLFTDRSFTEMTFLNKELSMQFNFFER